MLIVIFDDSLVSLPPRWSDCWLLRCPFLSSTKSSSPSSMSPDSPGSHLVLLWHPRCCSWYQGYFMGARGWEIRFLKVRSINQPLRLTLQLRFRNPPQNQPLRLLLPLLPSLSRYLALSCIILHYLALSSCAVSWPTGILGLLVSLKLCIWREIRLTYRGIRLTYREKNNDWTKRTTTSGKKQANLWMQLRCDCRKVF